MNARVFFDVDPRTLRLPGSRRSGVDPIKLHRQIAQFGSSTQGMPPLEVSRGTDGELVINNGGNPCDVDRQVVTGSDSSCRSHRRSANPGGIVPIPWGFDTMKISVADELVEAMGELRELFPDWRMGQLVANLVTAAGGTDPAAIWDMEDEQLLVAARRLVEKNRGRRSEQEALADSHAEPITS